MRMENILPQDLIKLRTMSATLEAALEALQHHVRFIEPAREGTHPLLTSHMLQDRAEELLEDVAGLEADIEEALEIQL